MVFQASNRLQGRAIHKTLPESPRYYPKSWPIRRVSGWSQEGGPQLQEGRQTLRKPLGLDFAANFSEPGTEQPLFPAPSKPQPRPPAPTSPVPGEELIHPAYKALYRARGFSRRMDAAASPSTPAQQGAERLRKPRKPQEVRQTLDKPLGPNFAANFSEPETEQPSFPLPCKLPPRPPAPMSPVPGEELIHPDYRALYRAGGFSRSTDDPASPSTPSPAQQGAERVHKPRKLTYSAEPAVIKSARPLKAASAPNQQAATTPTPAAQHFAACSPRGDSTIADSVKGPSKRRQVTAARVRACMEDDVILVEQPAAAPASSVQQATAARTRAGMEDDVILVEQPVPAPASSVQQATAARTRAGMEEDVILVEQPAAAPASSAGQMSNARIGRKHARQDQEAYGDGARIGKRARGNLRASIVPHSISEPAQEHGIEGRQPSHLSIDLHNNAASVGGYAGSCLSRRLQQAIEADDVALPAGLMSQLPAMQYASPRDELDAINTFLADMPCLWSGRACPSPSLAPPAVLQEPASLVSTPSSQQQVVSMITPQAAAASGEAQTDTAPTWAPGHVLTHAEGLEADSFELDIFRLFFEHTAVDQALIEEDSDEMKAKQRHDPQQQSPAQESAAVPAHSTPSARTQRSRSPSRGGQKPQHRHSRRKVQ